MRVAVYDRFWSTVGGGERYAGSIAQVLASDHDVVLLAHEAVDRAQLSERLHLDLSGVGVAVIPDLPDAVRDASRDVDLLVNASYLSDAVCAARHGLYVVYFPGSPDLGRSALRRRGVRTGRRLLLGEAPGAVPERGLHWPEPMRRHTVRWTDGDARFLVDLPARPTSVHVVLGRYLPGDLDPVRVEVTVDGRPAASTRLDPVRSRFDRRRLQVVSLPGLRGAPGRPVELGVRSPTFVPAALAPSGDRRRLGVPVVAVLVGDGAGARAAVRVPALVEAPPSFAFLDSYDRVLSISEFTRGWVRRLWGRDSDLLYPPVHPYPPGEKRPEILSVGRFFAPGSGHAKRQLELVSAFRALLGRVGPGWELHLVGGCSPEHRGYLDEVRRAAQDLPVHLHVDAPGAELARRYASASVYWHATGLGERAHRRPDRMEHFGITTVEAMSAGAVPVVHGVAGQREVVRHGIDGFLVDGVAGFVEHTAGLVADPRLRDRLARSARERAARFGPQAFAATLRRTVAELEAAGPPG